MTPSVQSVAKHALKPKLESGHTDSYYDQDSPHYMGGAHNVALQAASQKTMGGARNVALSVMDSQEELGGAHNAAYQSLKLQGSRRQKHQGSHQNFNLSERTTAAIIGFLLTFTLCIAFYVSFRNYHAALE